MIASQKEKVAATRGNRHSAFRRWLALAGGCWLLALSADAQSFNVLYTFSAMETNAVGGNPTGLTLSTNGNFYGTCVNEGTNEWGAIFKMTPTGTPTPLYSFTYGESRSPYDGANPYAGLTQGTNGLLYGVTQAGGSNSYGTIYDVTTNGTLTAFYSFASERGAHLTNANGASPQYPLVLNTNNGDFYGTAGEGGTNGFGTIFQVTHQGKVTVLYSFSNNLVDGGTPQGPLMLYTNGLLYGTTAGGGSNDYGTVFQLTAAGHETAIYSFTNGADGAAPQGPLIDGKDGHLYGTCSAGGLNGTGTIFKITTNGVLTPLYSFSPGTNYPYTSGVENQYNADGINPNVLLLGSDGNFYGLAFYGGLNGSGSIFQFTKSDILTVLYSFSYSGNGGPNSDGANPTSLLQFTNGNFYGTTKDGGTNADENGDAFGTFFTIGLPPLITMQPTNQSIALHSNASFRLTASNSQSCQWQFNGANLPNATNGTLSITNAQITNAGFYQAILTNINGATLSSIVTLNITNVPLSFLTGAGAVQYSGGQFSITLTNLTGQGVIIIEASSNLTQWTPIFTNPAGFGTLQFSDPTAGNYSFRYYRATTL